MSQKASLKEQLEILVQVQEVDTRIDQLSREKNSLPSELRVLEQSLNAAKKNADTKNNQIQEIEKVLRQTEAAVELNNDRKNRTSGKIEGVQNSKEYAAASKEVEQLDKMNAELEEKKKSSQEQIDALKKDMETLQAEVDKFQGEFDTKNSEVQSSQAKLDDGLSELDTKRNGILSEKVERPLLSRYDRVRKARAGLGIVPVVNGRCKGCNMMVPHQQVNQMRTPTEIQSCPSCHRIIFVPETDAAKDEAAASES